MNLFNKNIDKFSPGLPIKVLGQSPFFQCIKGLLLCKICTVRSSNYTLTLKKKNHNVYLVSSTGTVE